MKSFEFYLKRAAAEKLRGAESSESDRQNAETLVEFQKRISPRIGGNTFEPPLHFQRTLDRLEKVGEEELRLLWSAPPRHGKSELLFHMLAKFIARNPDKLCGYFSYSAEIAENKSRLIRDYAMKAGIKLRNDQKGAGMWKTAQGGGLLAGGIGGLITGEGLYCLVIDDPHKNRAEAESAAIRNRTVDWVSSTAMQRIEPNGAVVVSHTRWMPDDVIGSLETTWEYHSYKAIQEDGSALWPTRWSAAQLARRRQDVGEYDWASIYQSDPRPRGSAVFNGTQFYDTLPKRLKYAAGLDFAYTQKTYSDWSVAVILGKDPETGLIYVVDVLREQVPSPQFIDDLKARLADYGWPPVFSYIGGVERSTIDFAQTRGVKIDFEVAKTDKFARAQSCAAAWNSNKILLPSTPNSWTDAFVSELMTFTGVGDKHDDQVDAFAAAFKKLTIPPPARGIGTSPIFAF